MMTSNGFVGREQFLAASKRRFKEVPLPDGSKVRIRSITAGEWADSDAKNYDRKNGGFSVKGLKESELRLVVLSVIDGDGNQMFSDADIPELSKVDAGWIIPLYSEIKDHSGLKKNVEDAVKNCEATGEDSSHTSSSGQQAQRDATA